jgi:aerobic-type carbon monoxide dehydrogenase small subunit (CoxS/CutS family)
MAVTSTSKQVVALNINGDDYELAVAPSHTLLEVLREDAHLTGTKHGCEQGECGLCTVLIDGRPQFSCLTLAVEAEGCVIRTVEGLARNGELHPLQKAFGERGASQCGYCSPGMLMSAEALLERNPSPSRTEIREALAGNLCRCTG